MDVIREPGVAGALIRPGTLTVQARTLAHLFARAAHVVPNASSGIGFDAESRIADTQVRADAPAVRSATVSALREGRIDRGCRDGDASAGIRINGESRFAVAPIISDAHTVQAAAMSAIAGLCCRGRCAGDASAGIGVNGVSVSALRRTRSTWDASATVTVPRVPGSAAANVRRYALASVATTRAVWLASAGTIMRETGPASANVRRDAFAVVTTDRTMGNARLAVARRVGVSVKQSRVTLLFTFVYIYLLLTKKVDS